MRLHPTWSRMRSVAKRYVCTKPLLFRLVQCEYSLLRSVGYFWDSCLPLIQDKRLNRFGVCLAGDIGRIEARMDLYRSQETWSTMGSKMLLLEFIFHFNLLVSAWMRE